MTSSAAKKRSEELTSGYGLPEDALTFLQEEVARTAKRTFIVRFSDSIVGPKVTGVRPNKGKYAPLPEQPEEVKRFLSDLDEFKSVEDLHERAWGLVWKDYYRAEITLDMPLPPASVTQKVREAVAYLEVRGGIAADLADDIERGEHRREEEG